jgi:ligand-binding sensor domain-containing protein
MATSYGINRFDGLLFHSFIKSEHQYQSVLRNDFNCVFTDSKGRIWFGSHNGTIMMYNQEKDQFQNVSLDFEYHLEYPSISRFYESHNKLYALTSHGVLLYNEQSGTFNFAFQEFPVFKQIHVISNIKMMPVIFGLEQLKVGCYMLMLSKKQSRCFQFKMN